MKQKLLSVFLLFMLSLSACGGRGKPAANLKVDMTDFAFTPNQYIVHANQEITLQIQHNGTVEHDFIIIKYGTEVGEHFNKADSPNVYWQI